MKKELKPHILYIIDTLDLIKSNTPSNKEEFLNDANARDATLMRLQDIGEQLVRIRDNFEDFFIDEGDDSWHSLIGLRNIISHGYREIDFAIIWVILQDELPEFNVKVRELAKKYTND